MLLFTAYESQNQLLPISVVHLRVTHPLLERRLCELERKLMFCSVFVPMRHYLFVRAFKFAYLMSKNIFTLCTCDTNTTCIEQCLSAPHITCTKHVLHAISYNLVFAFFLFCFRLKKQQQQQENKRNKNKTLSSILLV